MGPEMGHLCSHLRVCRDLILSSALSLKGAYMSHAPVLQGAENQRMSGVWQYGKNDLALRSSCLFRSGKAPWRDCSKTECYRPACGFMERILSPLLSLQALDWEKAKCLGVAAIVGHGRAQ